MNIKTKQENILNFNKNNIYNKKDCYLLYKNSHYDFREIMPNSKFIKDVFNIEGVHTAELLITINLKNNFIICEAHFNDSGNILEISMNKNYLYFDYVIAKDKYGNKFDFTFEKIYHAKEHHINIEYIKENLNNLDLILKYFIENENNLKCDYITISSSAMTSDFYCESDNNILHLSQDITEIENNARSYFLNHENNTELNSKQKYSNCQSYIAEELSKKLNIKFHNC